MTHRCRVRRDMLVINKESKQEENSMDYEIVELKEKA